MIDWLWLRVILTSLAAAGIFMSLLTIDKPRKPITPGTWVLSALFSAGLIWAYWTL